MAEPVTVGRAKEVGEVRVKAHDARGRPVAVARAGASRGLRVEL